MASSSSSSSSSASHSSTGSGGGGGAARLEASEAMDRDLLNSFGDSIGGADNYNNGMPNYNAMMMMNPMNNPMMGNMFDMMNSGPFGQYLGLLPQGMGPLISPQGMPFSFPYPMPSPAQVAATAAAMAAAQHQYSHPSKSGGKPTRGTKRDQKNTDGMAPMPPLNKRKVVALSTADRQDRKMASSSSSFSLSSSNHNQDMESMNSSNGGNTTMMTTTISGISHLSSNLTILTLFLTS